MVAGCQLALAVDHEDVRASCVRDVVAQPRDDRCHALELFNVLDRLGGQAHEVRTLHNCNSMIVVMEWVSSLIVFAL